MEGDQSLSWMVRREVKDGMVRQGMRGSCLWVMVAPARMLETGRVVTGARGLYRRQGERAGGETETGSEEMGSRTRW